MKNLVLTFTFVTALFSITAWGDIQDRINSCENKGGGSCVFALLRELAANNGGGNSGTTPVTKCKCSTQEWEPGMGCEIGQFKYKLTRDDHQVGNSRCFPSADAAYTECVRKSNADPACR
jgi:hypothetical protein